MPATAAGQEPYAVEPVTAQASAYLPDSLVKGLEPEGSRLFTYINGLKTTVCEVWWVKDLLPQDGLARGAQLKYGNLRAGSLVGVIHYFAGTGGEYHEDFRDQKLRPGFYTMRYARMPEDSPHKGVNPYPDFLLLSPVSVDRDPSRVLEPEELLRNSRFASRTTHPAVLSLVPATETANQATPVVRTDDAGSCILQVRLQAKANSAPHPFDLAIILVKPIPLDGAS
jgi:hypothetical protein